MQSLQKRLLITLLIGGFGTTVFSQESTSNKSDGTNRAAEVDHSDSFTLAEQHAAARLSEHVSTSEWLGPLAPVALSPFFGITCLSGMAIFGEGWLPADHFLTRASTPLKNPVVFYSFLTLTVLTSVPRLSKVSKPFAQAVDQLEAYAGIIT
ncbi:MAG: hypothetical protein KDA87_25990, partial [Planctomycetales bacterium]|nr:hypothetical protein [Planctomycetales bacterium]